MTEYRIIVSKRAARMLTAHTAFLAKVSKNAAERLVDSFEKAAHSLEQMPQRCPWLKAEHIPANKYRYLIFEKRYLLLFQIKEQRVYLDYIIDGRQDFGWLLSR